MSWKPSGLNRLQGPDSAATRALFEDLRKFLQEPTFERGIRLWTGAATAYDPATGLTPEQASKLFVYPSDVQHDKAPFTFTAQAALGGSVVFPKVFTAAPTVEATVRIGGNLDLNVNVQSVSTTGFTYRIFQNTGVNVSGSGDLHWTARGVL